MASPVLILPGIGNSGPAHWQSLWEAADPAFVRVQQEDWENPVCADWVANLEQAVRAAGPDTVLVAHSLACLAVAHWAARSHSPIKGALLVAVPEPQGPEFPAQANGFAQTPTAAFDFPSILVASSDDPYGSLDHARRLAECWGSQVVEIGARGHINASSGLGDWPAGLELLAQLQETAEVAAVQ